MRIRIGLVAAAMLALAVVPALADTITLQDLGTTATIETTPDSYGRVGMTNWSIDGSNYLYEQWFWIRIGDAVGQTSLEQLYQGYTQDPAKTTATMKFGTTSGVTVDVVYGLLGGGVGSGTADITEQIRIRNLTGQTQTISFFQYCDFDLGGLASDDTVWMRSENVVEQTNGLFRISETSAIPTASRYELGKYPSTLSNLNSGATYNLATVIDEFAVFPSPAITGDVTWAFQWDITLANGASFIISKDKHLVVPEPLTMISGFLAISSLGMYLRRRTAPKA
jgi:hypothetical protein